MLGNESNDDGAGAADMDAVIHRFLRVVGSLPALREQIDGGEHIGDVTIAINRLHRRSFNDQAREIKYYDILLSGTQEPYVELERAILDYYLESGAAGRIGEQWEQARRNLFERTVEYLVGAEVSLENLIDQAVTFRIDDQSRRERFLELAEVVQHLATTRIGAEMSVIALEANEAQQAWTRRQQRVDSFEGRIFYELVDKLALYSLHVLDPAAAAQKVQDLPAYARPAVPMSEDPTLWVDAAVMNPVGSERKEAVRYDVVPSSPRRPSGAAVERVAETVDGWTDRFGAFVEHHGGPVTRIGEQVRDRPYAAAAAVAVATAAAVSAAVVVGSASPPIPNIEVPQTGPGEPALPPFTPAQPQTAQEQLISVLGTPQQFADVLAADGRRSGGTVSRAQAQEIYEAIVTGELQRASNLLRTNTRLVDGETQPSTLHLLQGVALVRAQQLSDVVASGTAGESTFADLRTALYNAGSFGSSTYRMQVALVANGARPGAWGATEQAWLASQVQRATNSLITDAQVSLAPN